MGKSGCAKPDDRLPRRLGLLVAVIAVVATAALLAPTIAGAQPVATFTVAPSSPQPTGTTLTFTASATDSSATITSYAWNWGDSPTDTTSTTSDATTHTYAAPGTYTVTLTVTDGDGEEGTATQEVTVEGPPPTASFTASPSTPEVADTAFGFDATGSSDADSPITSYVWSWGDGSTDGTGSTANHTYLSAGSYSVTLTVTNADGQTGQVNHVVSVTPPPPVAAFNPGEAIVLTYSTLSFDGTLSSDPGGTITGYSWSFGDGSTSSVAKPTHAYSSQGIYTVTLTVTDSNNNSSKVSHQVIVVPAPGPAILIEPPVLLTSGGSSTTAAGVVDLGRRVFCLAYGPSCSAALTSTSVSLARDPAAAPRIHAREAASKLPAKTTPKSPSSTKPVSKPPAKAAPKPTAKPAPKPTAKPAPKPTAKPAPKPTPSAGTATFTIASGGSVELTLRISKQALALLHKRGRLPLKVTVAMTRGTQRVTDVVTLTLRYAAPKKS